MPAAADTTLDSVLALQLAIAWAGEARCEPRRLGWWDTDLIDEAGGGDLFARLTPRTHAWASLEAVREAARRVDAKARVRLGDPDKLRSLFFLGFELDERLGDRLAYLKRQANPPAEALAMPFAMGGDFSAETVSTALTRAGTAKYEIVPHGRELPGEPPKDAVELARMLGAALVPFTSEYPLPFFRVRS